MRKLCLVILAALTLAATALADEPMMMKPDPMLRQLDYFAGNWTCSGTAFAMPGSPEHATKGNVTVSWGLNGYWLPFSYRESKTTANPMPFRVDGFFGYDVPAKKLVIGSVDNMGGYNTEQSDGWNGDTLVFTGPWHMTSGLTTGRDTFMKKGANTLWHLAEVEMNGSWMRAAEETCMRAKK